MDRDAGCLHEPGQPGPVRLAPVGPGGERRAAAIAAFVLVVVALAALKPWAAPSAPGPAASAARTSAMVGSPVSSGLAARSDPAGPATSSASAAPRSGITDPDAQCPSVPAWRAYAVLEEHGGRVVGRYAVDPVVARAPADPAIPVVIVATGSVLALGFCAPAPATPAVPGAPVATDVRAVRAWSIGSSGAVVALALRPVEAHAPVGAAFGAVYTAPTEAVGSQDEWPAGTYVFEVDAGPVSRSALWFAVRVVRVPTLESSSASPRAAPTLVGTPAPT